VSTATDDDIKSLVMEEFLAPQELSGYRCALGQDVPAPDSGEIVVFVDFFRRGFGIPVHWFVRDLLNHYDAQVHHLTPNRVLLLAMFVSFCEDFAGIKPHWALFLRCFDVLP
jgi:hypothetical protein